MFHYHEQQPLNMAITTTSTPSAFIEDNQEEQVLLPPEAHCILCKTTFMKAAKADLEEGEILGGGGDGEGLLRQILLLNKLLMIPLKDCTKYLNEGHGMESASSPVSTWDEICPLCSQLIKEGRELIDLIERSQIRLQAVQAMLQKRVNSHSSHGNEDLAPEGQPVAFNCMSAVLKDDIRQLKRGRGLVPDHLLADEDTTSKPRFEVEKIMSMGTNEAVPHSVMQMQIRNGPGSGSTGNFCYVNPAMLVPQFNVSMKPVDFMKLELEPHLNGHGNGEMYGVNLGCLPRPYSVCKNENEGPLSARAVGLGFASSGLVDIIPPDPVTTSHPNPNLHCNLCGRFCSTTKNLQHHHSTHLLGSAKKCKFCDLAFDFKHEKKRHYQVAHINGHSESRNNSVGIGNHKGRYRDNRPARKDFQGDRGQPKPLFSSSKSHHHSRRDCV